MENFTKSDAEAVKEICKRLNHRLVDYLGSGASGCVFEAIEVNLREKRAIKAMKHNGERSVVRLIIEEIEVMKKFCQLPGFVKLYDHFIEGSYVLLVMEYCQEGNLESFKKKKKHFSYSEVQIYAYQLSRSIYALHSKDYLHRDMKPSNILINNEHDFLLADFGLCYKLSEGSRSVETGKMGGTMIYAAPEVRNGGKQTSACDIWGIGVIIAYLIFDEKIFMEILSRQSAELVNALLKRTKEYSQHPLVNFLSALFLPVDSRPDISGILTHPLITRCEYRSMKDCRNQTKTIQVQNAGESDQNNSNKSNDRSHSTFPMELLLYAHILNRIRRMENEHTPDNTTDQNSQSSTNSKGAVPQDKKSRSSQDNVDQQVNSNPQKKSQDQGRNPQENTNNPSDTESIDVNKPQDQPDISKKYFSGGYLLLIWSITVIVTFILFISMMIISNIFHIGPYTSMLIVYGYRLGISPFILCSLITVFQIGCLTKRSTELFSLNVKSWKFILFVLIIPILLDIVGYTLLRTAFNDQYNKSENYMKIILPICYLMDLLFWLLILSMKGVHICANKVIE